MKIQWPCLSITQKFIGYLMFVSVIPLLLVGLVSYHITYTALKEEASRHTLALVVDQRDYLELQLEQIESLIANLSGVEEITNALDEQRTFADRYTSLATQARIGYILNGYSNLRGLVSIDIFTTGGSHYHVGDTLDVGNIRTTLRDRIFAQALDADQPVSWIGIENNVNVNSAHRKVIMAARVLTKTDRQTLQQRPLALLLVNYGIDYLYDHFSRIDLGKDAYLMIVDAQNRIIYHPDRSLLGSAVKPAFMQKLITEDRMVVKIIDGQPTSISYIRSDRSDWTVLGVVPLHTLMAKTSSINQTTFLLMITCFGIAGLAALLYNRGVVAPILGIIDRFKQFETNSLDLNTRLEVARNDEIGELIHWFNAFITNLAARQASEQALRESEERLRYDALHDALTGLPNRIYLLDHLQSVIDRCIRKKDSLFAVLFLDLDHFKRINDSLGHNFGDALLIKVAQRLRRCVRATDTVARLGGDEFVILLEDTKDLHSITLTAERILARLTAPYDLNGQQVIITTSIGIAISSTGYDQPETVLRDADIALYRAKGLGKACYEIFDTVMGEQIMERLALETDLRQAVERQELQVYYQPIVALDSATITGFETLLRWSHPQRGIVSPIEFIPLAEETGLIIPIGEWVLRTVCVQARVWQEEGILPLRVAVNLSPRQFMQPNLVNMVKQVLQDTGLKAQYLEFEITESLLMQDVDVAVAALNALKTMGVWLAIDDFGTGYSSLAYLKRFPIDQLKIDQSFVQDIATSPDDAAIALAVIAMAHSMKLRVTAEGVETEAQLAFLKSKGCHEGQGYFFSEPLPAEEATRLLRDGSCWLAPSLSQKVHRLRDQISLVK